MEFLTTEQVLALAPDAASVKAGQGLAGPGKWVTLGRGGRSVWGECQGSGKMPYRTQADLSGPAFHCSCPSRKFPCKHGLGLLLLLTANPARVLEADPPAWVAEWIAKREAGKKAPHAAPPDAETAAKRDTDREKRAAKREDRVRAGLAELQTWIGDLLRQGLAHGKQQPAQFYDAMAARMVDAQAPGIARRLRGFPGLFASGDGWADRTLEEAGALQWLLHGFAHLDTLPDGLRASVRNAIGWNVAEQELTANKPVRDHWQVAGQIVEEEEKLRVQRTWLIGEKTRQPALSLSFAAMNQALDVSLIAGTVFEADLTYYPSPLRALVGERHGEPRPLKNPAGAAHANFSEALDQTASFLAIDPWLERTPWLVRDCLPLCVNEKWMLRDAAGALVPLARTFLNTWPLFAVSGGAPINIFGEWNGHELRPLSVFAGERFIPMGGSLP
ncbi:MAG: zinc finger, domain protein [Chthoniobacteraceae bacterium]|nr:zinc finger, domain protein [Chthoniobacteraceae bacterium]